MSIPVTVTYFDTAMTLIEIGSIRLLTDPVFDPAGTTFDYGPVHLEKTIGGRVSPAELGHIDVVLLSHDQHGDNLDGAGRAFLAEVPLVLTTPTAALRLAGVRAEGLESWQSKTVTGPNGEVHVTAVPAQHGPDGTQEVTGPVTGFLVESANQSAPLYISGDTVPFAGTEEIASRYAPIGLALLNLGHVSLAPMPGVFLSLSGEQASRYAEALQARSIVPIHFEGWRHFSEGRNQAELAFASSKIADRVHWLNPGVPAIFNL
jgi:L-ascorbate metabolism protein UlaG (beta-lactamase superfamily)